MGYHPIFTSHAPNALLLRRRALLGWPLAAARLTFACKLQLCRRVQPVTCSQSPMASAAARPLN
jgi:hypothetical protein